MSGRGFVGATLVAAVVFAAVTAGLLSSFPQPRTRTDYLVIGAIATLAALGALFAAWITRRAGAGHLLPRRRRK